MAANSDRAVVPVSQAHASDTTLSGSVAQRDSPFNLRADMALIEVSRIGTELNAIDAVEAQQIARGADSRLTF